MANTHTPEMPHACAQDAGNNNQAAFYQSIRKTDMFLCSYPRSGTTWLGYLIAQVVKRDAGELLDLKSFNNYVPEVDSWYAKRASLVKFTELANPRVFLCHAAYDPLLPKVVYVTRDPRDTMVSCWHYRKFLSRDFKMSLAEYLRSDNHWPCEWDEHAAGWLLPQQHPKMLMVRYEDLHNDTAGVLRNVLNFTGIKYSEACIEPAVEASRFQKMRIVEQQSPLNPKTGDPYEQFIRKGRVGNWQEEMGYAELRIIEEKYGKVMRQVGYEPLS